MRKILSALAVCCLATRAADWPTVAGNPQRDGWAKSETAFTKENVKGLELLYKYKADTAPGTPMVNGRLITYLGFKEMLVFGGAGDMAYSVDADLNRLIWKAHLDTHPGKASGAGACADGSAAPMAMAGSSTAVVARALRPVVVPGASAPAVAARRPNRGGEFFTVSSDGYLHVLNPSTGEDRTPPVKFVPPNSKVTALNVSDGVIYAATAEGCGGKPDALYAFDLAAEKEDKRVATQTAQDGSIVGMAGTAIGADGFIYAQARNFHGDRNDAVFALHPKTLSVKDYFIVKNSVAENLPGATPVVFTWKDQELIAAGGADGNLYLLDTKALRKPLFQGDAMAPGSFRGAFATWEDPESKERWLYGSAQDRVMGFKVEDRGGKPALTKVWSSEAMANPSAPAIANGLVFALSAGGLSALDAATGKVLYNSGKPVTSEARGGLAIANRRIYFSTRDNSVYCFGFVVEQPQLTGK